MKKNISKDQIIETTLELMKNKNNLQGLNLREIARTLGCAHTNLYNYFPSYNDLLWEAHTAILEASMEILTKKLNTAKNAELRLTCFFEAFVETYLNNKGWFWLVWHEYIDGVRPQKYIEALERTNEILHSHLSEIWNDIYGKHPYADTTKRILHNTHCYIVGEISNHLLGRDLIEDETKLKDYIIREAVSMFRMCLAGSEEV